MLSLLRAHPGDRGGFTAFNAGFETSFGRKLFAATPRGDPTSGAAGLQERFGLYFVLQCSTGQDPGVPSYAAIELHPSRGAALHRIGWEWPVSLGRTFANAGSGGRPTTTPAYDQDLIWRMFHGR